MNTSFETIEFAERFFLENFFARLNQENIRYAVMRNYWSLPYSTGGSDVDIVIAPVDESRFSTLLYEIIRNSTGVLIGVAEQIGFFKIFTFGVSKRKTNDWWGVCIDVNVGLFFKGQSLLANETPLPVKLYHEIYVLPEDFAGILGSLKEILHNEILPLQYTETARQSMENSWTCVEKLLAPMGDEALASFYSLLIAEHSSNNLQKQCRQIRRKFFKYALRCHPIKSCWQRIRYEWSKVRRYLKPSGVVIAVTGVDGTGKSTVIEAILPVLNAATHNAVFVQHLRPQLLPSLSFLKGKKPRPSRPVTDPHGSRPSGVVGSLVRLAWLTFDYIFGYWIKIRPKTAKLPAVVIFDRYAYDMVIDPQRFRIGLPSRIIKWFSAIAPKPDLNFCLYGDPEVIAKRKQELSVDETSRQVKALQKFARSKPNAVLIATDRNIEATRDEILHTLWNFLHHRMKNSRPNG